MPMTDLVLDSLSDDVSIPEGLADALQALDVNSVEFNEGGEYEAHQIVIRFANGYGISVISSHSDMYRPSGIYDSDDTFEVAVLEQHGDELTYDTPITNDVLSNVTFDELLDVMEQANDL